MAARAVLGFTGAFGSGCTESSKMLRDDSERPYHYVPLSDEVRKEWKARKADTEASRKDLQGLGDDLRRENGPGVLVERALAAVPGDPELLVVDSIRNLGEVRALRERYSSRFSLIAVVASQDERWRRIHTAYTDKGLTAKDFLQDDARDRNEETPYGQQVELCIDAADMLIDNDKKNLLQLNEKVIDLAALASGDKHRYAEPTEIWMHMAYSSSHSSKCLKRHVGAIIVNEQGDVVGVGYNENPTPTHPCVEEPLYNFKCFRDIVRNGAFRDFVEEGVRCPVCGEPLEVEDGPPWRCGKCADKGTRTDLDHYFFPERAMTWCTAVHAEVRALLAAGPASRKSTLFTTTFPCFQCAEKITQAGIKEVWFTEVYVDQDSAKRLEMADIETHQFEGVRSAAFERIFSTMNPRN